MRKNKLTIIAGMATIFTFLLTSEQNTQEVAAKRTNNYTVTYTLNRSGKNLKKKSIKVAKKATVMTGLKKAWRVESTNGFVTAIDGKKQNPAKKIYWTYTINGKFANKGVTQQRVANHDKIKFTLAKIG
ncbi:DUF4430 domain-containing protein [Lactobacillus sp. ESL0228]|uniref:DUF4430 domain-containing protein n=1 Tax=Lactobacillus sp. ESL0228 TaxID=2069352 RepID=UPI000EFB3A5A|nr:DUF4430 domain-containing protein [Lactobacillus sp. ESL0228]RMC52103.1 DUF4430 domain-containing protein [Lactobacillus sp. ESL0228]